jgi:hypothetical protein
MSHRIQWKPRMTSRLLPSAPSAAVFDNAPATGRYAGNPEQIDWSGLGGEFRRSALWRKLHHKCWHYVGIATGQCFIGVAIVDIGWTNTAFAYLFDRREKKLLVDFSQDGLPGVTARVSERPVSGAVSWFRHLGASLRYEHVAGPRYKLTVATRNGLKIDAEIDQTDAAPFLTAIGPIANGGCAHSTVKSSALSVKGVATVGNQTFVLDDGIASFDYSNGLLARDTAWRWASAHSREVGFNLQQGYFGNYENALWLDGALIPLGQARFDFDPRQPLAPWKISTDDGLLDLVFQPEGARQESKNLIVAASYYIQPIGTFSGTIKAAPDAPPRRVEQLVGVTEDHRSRW